MVEVPDEKLITGLTRSELIALIFSLKKERDETAAKHAKELKEVRVRLESASAHVHAIVNELEEPARRAAEATAMKANK